jgi:hypothetical protein
MRVHLTRDGGGHMTTNPTQYLLRSFVPALTIAQSKVAIMAGITQPVALAACSGAGALRRFHDDMRLIGDRLEFWLAQAGVDLSQLPTEPPCDP